jgi:uncharacterized protein with von Willebrand factor type A (vWA) domain
MSLAVLVDRWDAPELERAQAVPAFVRQRELLAERFPWGGVALDDIFWLLYKARPELTARADVDGSYLVGHVLVSLLAHNPAVERLRHSTMRDVTGAALVAAQLAPELALAATAAASPSDQAEALELAEQEAAARPEEEWLQDLVDQRREALADATTEAAEGTLEALETTCEAVADREEGRARMAEMWGVEDGALRRLPLAEREALARQFDNPQTQAITDLFGRLRNAMFAERAEIDGFGVEPVDVEVGGDLSRMVGAELMSMLQGNLFYARLGDGALRQYATHGVDEAGRGGIVLCTDCSASMAQPHQGYTRELWASALRLHLLQVAMRENRPLHLINFSTAVSYYRFVDPAERTPLRLLEASSEWYGYGTRFAGPLLKAVDVLAEEDDRDCDVVFVSDGECNLSGRTRLTYERAARSRGVRTWGVQLGRRPGGLADFCDRIFTITDLTSGGELGDLLNAVESPASLS